MKKIVSILVAMAALTACQKSSDVPATAGADAPPAAAVQDKPDGAAADRSASLLWRDLKTGQNQIWRFEGDATARTLGLWATEADWSPLAFVPQGWGDDDLAVWRSKTTGEVRLWKVLANVEEPVVEVLPPAGEGWRIAAVTDADADGDADLVWAGANGEVAVWTLRDGKVADQAVIGNTGGGWTLAQVGDFDADGRGDLFWRKDDGSSASVWMLEGLAIKTTRGMADAGTGWTPIAAGRFDGEAGDDLLWRDGAGNLAVWSAADVARAITLSRQAPADWAFLAALDIDRDGRDDLMWNNSQTRQSGAWMIAEGGGIADRSLPPVGDDWTVVSPALVVR